MKSLTASFLPEPTGAGFLVPIAIGTFASFSCPPPAKALCGGQEEEKDERFFEKCVTRESSFIDLNADGIINEQDAYNESDKFSVLIDVSE